jgi:hypothetical protein
MIGDGAAVNFGNTDYPNIETIEGEGNARILYGVSYLDFNDNETMRYFGNINFYYVQNLSGVSCSPLWKDKVGNDIYVNNIPENTSNCSFTANAIYNIGDGAKNCIFDGGNPGISVIGGNAENCSYKGKWLYFMEYKTNSASFSKCKFELMGDDNFVYMQAPAQSSSIPSFDISFNNCEFSSNAKFTYEIITSIPILDEKGNKVLKDTYGYWMKMSEEWGIWWNYNETTDINSIPDEVRALGRVSYDDFWGPEDKSQVGYLLYENAVQYESVNFNNYIARAAFNSCMLGGSALTSSNINVGSVHWVPDGAKLYYTIESVDYEPQWGDNDNIILVKPNAGTRGAYNRANQRYVKPIFHQIPKRHKSPTRNQSIR